METDGGGFHGLTLGLFEEVAALVGGHGKAGSQLHVGLAAAALVHAQNQLVAVLGLLDRVEVDVIGRTQEGGERVAGHVRRRAHREIQLDALLDDVALRHGAGVGQQRVGELVMAHVALGARVLARLEQRDVHHVVLDGMAVLAVVQQRHAVALLGQIGPLVGDDLEAGVVPAGVEVGRALHVAVLDVVGRLGGADVHREARLQHAMALVPLGLGPEVDAAAVSIDDHVLHEGGPAIGVLEADHRAQRAVLHQHGFPDQRHILVLEQMEDVDVPVVVGHGLVLVDLQRVGLRAIGQHLAAVLAVEQANQAALLVPRDVVTGRAQRAGGHVDFEGARGGPLLARNEMDRLGGQGQQLHLHPTAAVHALGGQLLVVGVAEFARASLGNEHLIFARKAAEVPEHPRVLLGMSQRGQRVGAQRGQTGLHLAVLPVAVLVDLVDGRAGNDVVELVAQDGLPAGDQRILIVGAAGKHGHAAEPLALGQHELHAAVHHLVPRLRGVGATMVLQIQLAVPDGHVLIGVLKVLVHAAEEIAGAVGFDVGQTRQLIHGAAHLEHVAVHAAAAVAVAVGQQRLAGQVLVVELAPAAQHGARADHAVVGGEAALVKVAHLGCGDEIGHDLAAVDAAPLEQIVGHGVVLVPADLRGHEGVDAHALQNLRQRPAVAEHVGQPEVFAPVAEFLLQKAHAVEELAGQGFSGGDVAVRLQPHAAVGLPATLGRALLHLLVDLRAVVFDVLIQLRLALQEDVLVEFLHQAQHSGEGALGLFPGVLQPPQPRHVDVGVAHDVDRDLGLLPEHGQLGPELPKRRADGIVEAVRVPVDLVERAIQRLRQGILHSVAVVQQPDRLDDGLGQIVQLVGVRMEIAHLGLLDAMAQLALRAAALHARPEHERQNHGLSGEGLEVHVVVVGVHALIGMAVHVQQRFKAAVVAAAGLAEVEQAVNLAAVGVLGQRHGLLRPEIAIAADEFVADIDLTALDLPGHAVVHVVHAQSALHGGHGRDGLHVHEAEVLQLAHAAVELIQRQKHFVGLDHSGIPPVCSKNQ